MTDQQVSPGSCPACGRAPKIIELDTKPVQGH